MSALVERLQHLVRSAPRLDGRILLAGVLALLVGLAVVLVAVLGGSATKSPAASTVVVTAPPAAPASSAPGPAAPSTTSPVACATGAPACQELAAKHLTPPARYPTMLPLIAQQSTGKIDQLDPNGTYSLAFNHGGSSSGLDLIAGFARSPAASLQAALAEAATKHSPVTKQTASGRTIYCITGDIYNSCLWHEDGFTYAAGSHCCLAHVLTAQQLVAMLTSAQPLGQTFQLTFAANGSPQAIGPFRIDRGDRTLADAVRAFGAPTSTTAKAQGCETVWQGLGLKAYSLNYNAVTCDPAQVYVMFFVISSPTFATSSGLQVGLPESAIVQREPTASTRGPSDAPPSFDNQQLPNGLWRALYSVHPTTARNTGGKPYASLQLVTGSDNRVAAMQVTTNLAVH